MSRSIFHIDRTPRNGIPSRIQALAGYKGHDGASVSSLLPPRAIQIEHLSETTYYFLAGSIPKAQQWRQAYKGKAPLLDFSQGVPGDPPHPKLLEALATTSSSPSSAGYGPILGEESLREGMAVEMKRLYQWSSDAGPSASEIAITSGCNQAYLAVMMALCMPGDEVIIPVPWVSMRQVLG